LTFWKSIFDRSEQKSISTSNKKLLISKTSTNDVKETSSINWKEILPSLELFHHEQLDVKNKIELIRPLFSMLEKSLSDSNGEFEEKTYFHQLAITALLNIYGQLKSGKIFAQREREKWKKVSRTRSRLSRLDFITFVNFLDQCHADAFNSEIVMECLKRTNDLHTTQQCLMLLSKGAQLFPVEN
jgi:hypothetical protein